MKITPFTQFNPTWGEQVRALKQFFGQSQLWPMLSPRSKGVPMVFFEEDDLQPSILIQLHGGITPAKQG
jgi:hypothetical protein